MKNVTWDGISPPSIADIQLALAVEETEMDASRWLERTGHPLDIGLDPMIGAQRTRQQGQRSTAAHESNQNQTTSVDIHLSLSLSLSLYLLAPEGDPASNSSEQQQIQQQSVEGRRPVALLCPARQKS